MKFLHLLHINISNLIKERKIYNLVRGKIKGNFYCIDMTSGGYEKNNSDVFFKVTFKCMESFVFSRQKEIPLLILISNKNQEKEMLLKLEKCIESIYQVKALIRVVFLNGRTEKYTSGSYKHLRLNLSNGADVDSELKSFYRGTNES